MQVPDDLRLRLGNDTCFVNIDAEGKEIGHLRIDEDGHVLQSWAIHLEDRPLVTLVSRIFNETASIMSNRG